MPNETLGKRKVKVVQKGENTWVLVRFTLDDVMSVVKLSEVEDESGQTGAEIDLKQNQKCSALFKGEYFDAVVVAVNDDKDKLLKEKEKLMKKSNQKKKGVHTGPSDVASKEKDEQLPTIKHTKRRKPNVDSQKRELATDKKKVKGAQAETLRHAQLLLINGMVSEEQAAQTQATPQTQVQTHAPLTPPTPQGASQSPRAQLPPQTQLLQKQLPPQTHLPPQSQLPPQLPPQSQLPPQTQLPPQSQTQLLPQSQTQLSPHTQLPPPAQVFQRQLPPQTQSPQPWLSQTQLAPQTQTQAPVQTFVPLTPTKQVVSESPLTQTPPQIQTPAETYTFLIPSRTSLASCTSQSQISQETPQIQDSASEIALQTHTLQAPKKSLQIRALSQEPMTLPTHTTQTVATSPTCMQTQETIMQAPQDFKSWWSSAQSTLNEQCPNCSEIQFQYSSLLFSYEEQQKELSTLRAQCSYLQEELGTCMQQNQDCSPLRSPARKHYIPKRGMIIQFSNYKLLKEGENCPTDYERMGVSQVAVPKTWLHATLAKCRGKSTDYVAKKLIDGFFEPEDLCNATAAQLADGNAIMEAIKLYCANELNISGKQFMLLLNSKINSARRTVKRQKE